MPAKKPTLGYPSQTECCLALREQGKSNAEIARMIGIQAKTVAVLLHREVRRSRPAEQNHRTIVFANDVLEKLAPHAIKRKITVSVLARRLVEIAAEEDLIAAILDDGGEIAKAAA